MSPESQAPPPLQPAPVSPSLREAQGHSGTAPAPASASAPKPPALKRDGSPASTPLPWPAILGFGSVAIAACTLVVWSGLPKLAESAAELLWWRGLDLETGPLAQWLPGLLASLTESFAGRWPSFVFALGSLGSLVFVLEHDRRPSAFAFAVVALPAALMASTEAWLGLPLALLTATFAWSHKHPLARFGLPALVLLISPVVLPLALVPLMVTALPKRLAIARTVLLAMVLFVGIQAVVSDVGGLSLGRESYFATAWQGVWPSAGFAVGPLGGWVPVGSLGLALLGAFFLDPRHLAGRVCVGAAVLVLGGFGANLLEDSAGAHRTIARLVGAFALAIPVASALSLLARRLHPLVAAGPAAGLLVGAAVAGLAVGNAEREDREQASALFGALDGLSVAEPENQSVRLLHLASPRRGSLDLRSRLGGHGVYMKARFGTLPGTLPLEVLNDRYAFELHSWGPTVPMANLGVEAFRLERLLSVDGVNPDAIALQTPADGASLRLASADEPEFAWTVPVAADPGADAFSFLAIVGTPDPMIADRIVQRALDASVLERTVEGERVRYSWRPSVRSTSEQVLDRELYWEDGDLAVPHGLTHWTLTARTLVGLDPKVLAAPFRSLSAN